MLKILLLIKIGAYNNCIVGTILVDVSIRLVCGLTPGKSSLLEGAGVNGGSCSKEATFIFCFFY